MVPARLAARLAATSPAASHAQELRDIHSERWPMVAKCRPRTALPPHYRCRPAEFSCSQKKKSAQGILLTRNPRVDFLGDSVHDSGSVGVDALRLQPVPELVAVLHAVHLRNLATDRQAGRQAGTN